VLAGALLLIAGATLPFVLRDGEERLSKREYEQVVRSGYGKVQAAFQRTRGSSGSALADRVGETQDALRDAADELDGAKPPIQVVSEHRRLVEGMREYADDLDELRAAAERGDEQAVATFNGRTGANAAIRKIAEAAEEMKFEGYDLGPIAED
jgi:hypothetical protein